MSYKWCFSQDLLTYLSLQNRVGFLTFLGQSQNLIEISPHVFILRTFVKMQKNRQKSPCLGFSFNIQKIKYRTVLHPNIFWSTTRWCTGIYFVRDELLKSRKNRVEILTTCCLSKSNFSTFSWLISTLRDSICRMKLSERNQSVYLNQTRLLTISTLFSKYKWYNWC